MSQPEVSGDKQSSRVEPFTRGLQSPDGQAGVMVFQVFRPRSRQTNEVTNIESGLRGLAGSLLGQMQLLKEDEGSKSRLPIFGPLKKALNASGILNRAPNFSLTCE